jgi:hypothetical protein
VPDVATLLDPARTVADHTFFFELPPQDRAALLAYLETL